MSTGLGVNFSIYPPKLPGTLVLGEYKGRYDATFETFGGHPRHALTQRYVDSVRTYDFKSKRSKNTLPRNSYRVETEVVSQDNCRFLRDFGDGTTIEYRGSTKDIAFGLYARTSVLNRLSDADSSAMATNHVLSRVDTQRLNMAQAFVEHRQTANLLVNNLQRLATFGFLARRGNFSAAWRSLGVRSSYFNGKTPPLDRDDLLRGRRRWSEVSDKRGDISRVIDSKDMANFWLEYSFGVVPLMSDIFGAAELLASTFQKKSPRMVSGRSATFREFSLAESQTGTSFPSQGNYKLMTDYYLESRSKVAFAFDIGEPFKQIMASTGLTNPLLLAWEVIPYSFVWDWIQPVGKYLELMESCTGLDFWGGYRTSRMIGRSEQRIISGDYSIQEARVVASASKMTRDVLVTFPRPTFPKLQFDVGLNQVSLALALVRQAFKK